MIEANRDRRISTLWVALFTMVVAIGTLSLGCAMPFVALAAMASVHLSRRAALSLMGVCWAVSQVVGFGLLHYPHDGETIGWSAVMLVAALLTVPGAALATSAGAARPMPVRMVMACLGAFVAFKLVVLLGSLGLGGTAMLAAPGLLARQFGRDGLFLIGLLALYHVLVAAGVPSARSAGLRAA